MESDGPQDLTPWSISTERSQMRTTPEISPSPQKSRRTHVVDSSEDDGESLPLKDVEDESSREGPRVMYSS